MEQQRKDKIKELTRQKIELAGSQNKYASNIGVSAGTISCLLNDQWDKLSEKMWRKLEVGAGMQKIGWQICKETKGYKLMTDLLKDAILYSNVYFMIAPEGSGKTQSALSLAEDQGNIFHLKCAEYWNRKNFLSELLISMGINPSGHTVYDLMRIINEEVYKRKNPLLYIDEADKLKDEVLYFFISLYNAFYGKMAIVLAGTEFFEKRIRKGVHLNKKGYKEMFSRGNRRFVEFPRPSAYDISLVLRENGITDPEAIDEIIEESDFDYRRVKNLGHKYFRKLERKDGKP